VRLSHIPIINCLVPITNWGQLMRPSTLEPGSSDSMPQCCVSSVRHTSHQLSHTQMLTVLLLLYTTVLPITLRDMLERRWSKSTSCGIPHLNHTLVSAVQHTCSLYAHFVQIGKIQVTFQTISDRQQGNCFSEVELPHPIAPVSAGGYGTANCHTAGVLQRWRVLGPLYNWFEYFTVVKELTTGRLLFVHFVPRHSATGQQKDAYQ